MQVPRHCYVAPSACACAEKVSAPVRTYMVAESGSAEPRSAALRLKTDGSVFTNAESNSAGRAARAHSWAVSARRSWAGGSSDGGRCSSNGSIGSA
eukprot:14725206-Alexandrium_andersonii.AAC.1